MITNCQIFTFINTDKYFQSLNTILPQGVSTIADPCLKCEVTKNKRWQMSNLKFKIAQSLMPNNCAVYFLFGLVNISYSTKSTMKYDNFNLKEVYEACS